MFTCSLLLSSLLLAGCSGPKESTSSPSPDDTPHDSGHSDSPSDDSSADDTSTEEVDVDGDGYSVERDCDDTRADVHPYADEVCDDVDNDCDGEVNEGWYLDNDGDGWGSAVSAGEDCTGLSAARTNQDCDDTRADAHPRGDEVCDDVDNDCDGAIDDFGTYVDLDGDGYGGARRGNGCEDGVAYTDAGGDCDEGDPSVFPGNTEVCDGIDNDCDGEGDEELAWVDMDGDGYGDEERLGSCDPSLPYVAIGGDCDDADPAVNPSVCDACDGIDNDCSGAPDDGGDETTTFIYADEDGDGYGDDWLGEVWNCDLPAGAVSRGGDCDDDDATLNPDMVEMCWDGVDNDCDGALDCEDEDCGDDVCTETVCTDDVDGDGDGWTDCLDDDCWGVADCGYLVAQVRGGTLAVRLIEARGSGAPRSSATRAYAEGSVTGTVRAYSADGATRATCAWRVGHVYLSAATGKSIQWSHSGTDHFTSPSRVTSSSCVELRNHFTGVSGSSVAHSLRWSHHSLSRASIEVESGCGADDGHFLPDVLLHDGSMSFVTAAEARWYAGALTRGPSSTTYTTGMVWTGVLELSTQDTVQDYISP